jgi:hypothetical protein
LYPFDFNTFTKKDVHRPCNLIVDAFLSGHFRQLSVNVFVAALRIQFVPDVLLQLHRNFNGSFLVRFPYTLKLDETFKVLSSLPTAGLQTRELFATLPNLSPSKAVHTTKPLL